MLRQGGVLTLANVPDMPGILFGNQSVLSFTDILDVTGISLRSASSLGSWISMPHFENYRCQVLLSLPLKKPFASAIYCSSLLALR